MGGIKVTSTEQAMNAIAPKGSSIMEAIALQSGIHVTSLYNWRSGSNSASLDAFIDVVNAAGYEVMLNKRQ